MAAAWVALEDTTDSNGPLAFIPKSHQWGVWDFDEIGLNYEHDIQNSLETEKLEMDH